ncbi:MAG: hypothetical protein ACOVQ4_13120 [Flectobacillus sp.]|uniref:hypothetical protein n=1 Tax=Flectobacillus sp. TaxID=50419 RepID=UPI003B99B72D
MFVSKEEFQTHLYEEAQVVISRNDDAKVDTALRTAQRIVARHLSAYDTNAIFGASGEDKEKYEELILYVKDIAKWNFISVCNVQADLELAKQRYDDAIANLKSIQKTSIIPDWPLAQDNSDPQPWISGSQPKQNFFH